MFYETKNDQIAIQKFGDTIVHTTAFTNDQLNQLNIVFFRYDIMTN